MNNAGTMVARGGGSVINLVTSAAVRWDMATFGPPYAAVRGATRSLTRDAGYLSGVTIPAGGGGDSRWG